MGTTITALCEQNGFTQNIEDVSVRVHWTKPECILRCRNQMARATLDRVLFFVYWLSPVFQAWIWEGEAEELHFM